MNVIKAEPFHIQAYNLIKGEILSNQLACGERVSENTLAQKLNISRSPIREALRMLERDKLVVSTPAGLIVNPMPEGEVREIYECRMMLESFAARLAADRIREEDVAFLHSCIARSEEAHAHNDAAAVVDANTCFHDRIISLCGNAHLIEMNDLNRGLATMSRFREFEDYKRDSDYILQHKSVLDALERKDPDDAEGKMRAHIASDLEFYMRGYRASQRLSARGG